MKLSNQKSALALIAITALMNGCGGDEKKKANNDNSIPVVEEPSTQEVPVVDTPVVESKIDSLQLTDTKIDLEGDFRIKKVQRDAVGNYYVAVVSTVKENPTSQPVRGYVVIKFDTNGKELWRFPTVENASSTPNSNNKIGSYLVGNLTDMDVNKDGEILLFGLKSSMVQLTIDLRAVNFSPAKWPSTVWPASEANGNAQRSDFLGNLVFITKVKGSGVTAHAPIAETTTTLASPVWWQPIAISWEAAGSILIESSSGGNATGIVKNVERLNGKLTKISAATCYLAPKAVSASGSSRLAQVASTASASLVESMTAPLKMSIEIGAANLEAYNSSARSAVMAEMGRCWELFGAKVMSAEDTQQNIVKPTMLAAGQNMTFRVASEKDLLDKKQTFESYDLDAANIPLENPWYANQVEPSVNPFENPLAKWTDVESELVYLGLSGADLLGNRNLILSNYRLTEAKAWKVELQTNSMRQPASLDLMRADSELLIAWTDLHLAGETNAGLRALRIAKVDASKPSDDSMEVTSLDVPASVGHMTFTSVRLARASSGAAVFATAGTPSTDATKIEHATLLIGFTK